MEPMSPRGPDVVAGAGRPSGGGQARARQLDPSLRQAQLTGVEGLPLGPLGGAQGQQQPGERDPQIDDALELTVIGHELQRPADRLRRLHSAFVHRAQAVAPGEDEQLVDLLQQGVPTLQTMLVDGGPGHRAVGPGGQSGGLAGHARLHAVGHAVVAVALVEAHADRAGEGGQRIVGVHHGVPAGDLQGRVPGRGPSTSPGRSSRSRLGWPRAGRDWPRPPR